MRSTLAAGAASAPFLRGRILCGPRLLLLLAGSLLASGLSGGCVYFNTFYLARKYFGEAEKTQALSQSDKISPDAVTKYDLSIKQCTKVLSQHPDSRWADDAVYLMGACYYGKREYESALRKFDELMANYPKSKLVPWAHYLSGLCHYQRRDYELMDASFRKVLELKPDFDKKDEILFTQAQAAEEQRNRPEAIHRYRELEAEFHGSGRGEDALSHIGGLYLEEGATDSAYNSYTELAHTATDDKTAREAQLSAGDVLVTMGKPDDAVRLLKRLVIPVGTTQGAPLDEWQAVARLHLAQAQNAAGDHVGALKALREVTDKFATSTSAVEAQFQIGYTYEVYLDSLTAARTAYDQVSKMGGRSVFREQAANRSAGLAQLQALSQQARSDSATTEDKTAEASLKIAELYLLTRNQPEEALGRYREIVEKYPQSNMAARAAYAVAWIHLKAVSGKRDSALTELAGIVRKYPASRQARGALDLLIGEKADTAGLAGLLVALKTDTTAAPAKADSSATARPGSPGPHGPAPGNPARGVGRPPPFPGAPPDSLGRLAPLSGPNSPRFPRFAGYRGGRSDSLRSLRPDSSGSPDSSRTRVRLR